MQEFYYHLIYYLYFRSCCPIRIIMLGGRNYLDQKIYWGVDLGLLNAYLVLTPRTIWLKNFWISFNFEQTNSTNEATIFTVSIRGINVRFNQLERYTIIVSLSVDWRIDTAHFLRY